MRTSLLLTGLVAYAATLLAHPASAALLRPFSQITAGTIRLGDLFDNLGTTPDRVLGHAPAPGGRIVVASPQLAAIARDFNVDWRPQTGGEQAVVERRGDVLSGARVAAVLRRALADAGAPAEFDIATPDIQPILLPVGRDAEPAVSQLSYDPQPGTLSGSQNGRFTALVTVPVPDGEALQVRVSGQVVAMTRATVATIHLPPGSLVHGGDLRVSRIRAAVLHGAVPMQAEDAIGMVVRHDVPAGQALTMADVSRPALVQRGSLVRMSLNTEGLSLSAQGIAKEPGSRGDHIHVENPLSHLIVLAEVIGAGEVRVAPREPEPERTASLASAP